MSKHNICAVKSSSTDQDWRCPTESQLHRNLSATTESPNISPSQPISCHLCVCLCVCTWVCGGVMQWFLLEALQHKSVWRWWSPSNDGLGKFPDPWVLHMCGVSGNWIPAINSLNSSRQSHTADTHTDTHPGVCNAWMDLKSVLLLHHYTQCVNTGSELKLRSDPRAVALLKFTDQETNKHQHWEQSHYIDCYWRGRHRGSGVTAWSYVRRFLWLQIYRRLTTNCLTSQGKQWAKKQSCDHKVLSLQHHSINQRPIGSSFIKK